MAKRKREMPTFAEVFTARAMAMRTPQQRAMIEAVIRRQIELARNVGLQADQSAERAPLKQGCIKRGGA